MSNKCNIISDVRVRSPGAVVLRCLLTGVPHEGYNEPLLRRPHEGYNALVAETLANDSPEHHALVNRVAGADVRNGVETGVEEVATHTTEADITQDPNGVEIGPEEALDVIEQADLMELLGGLDVEVESVNVPEFTCSPDMFFQEDEVVHQPLLARSDAPVVETPSIPLPKTPRSYCSQISSRVSSVGTLPNVEDMIFQDSPSSPPLSPILGGSSKRGEKRKISGQKRGGKGRKIFKSAASSSSTNSSVFSQPDDNQIFLNFKNLVNRAVERDEECRRRKEVSDGELRKSGTVIQEAETLQLRQREKIEAILQELEKQKRILTVKERAVESLKKTRDEILEENNKLARECEKSSRRLGELKNF